jgi:hypothetical protein
MMFAQIGGGTCYYGIVPYYLRMDLIHAGF